ncbi:TerC family protein [Neobacillus cucumis]|uniref:TerC family protein n=1 Tax=Neobacillus cucumis TaxID=1740721 RepID=UPI001965FD8E|nr:TerC family protein [Neobacillus cucumis]MBM7651198.1 YjbE family integral membrane protein [Neobacillus cucumis]MED4228964.1 TerC family protein [Neobacillus cucumis]
MSFTVLLEVILINIVLSGDNAVLIAMASRNVPKKQQKKAIFWGTFGAIILRIIFAIGIVYLLALPFVTFVGGLLLVYIAIKLLIDEEEDFHREGGSSLISAVKMIITADAIMSLDNVLAIAGAVEGNIAGIVIGVIVSIPLVVFCSQIILKAMEKYPIISYAGAGILAWTAGEMMVGEPKLENLLPDDLHLLIPTAITVLVIGLGYLTNKIKTAKES